MKTLGELGDLDHIMKCIPRAGITIDGGLLAMKILKIFS